MSQASSYEFSNVVLNLECLSDMKALPLFHMLTGKRVVLCEVILY